MSSAPLEDWEQVKVTPVAWEKALLPLMDQIPKDQRQAALGELGKYSRVAPRAVV